VLANQLENLRLLLRLGVFAHGEVVEGNAIALG
jgi:hypothetical protein